MKKLFLFFIFSFIIFTANAQLSKDDVTLGASFANFNFQFNKYTDIKLTPQALWFTDNDFAIGGYVKFGVHHTNGNNGSTFEYGIGPMARYYIVNQDIFIKNFFLFTELNVGFDGQNNTVSDNNTYGLGFGFGPGLSYFITSSIGLEAKLKYDGVVGFGSSSYTNGINFSVGFQIYLPSRKIANTINIIQQQQ